MKNEEILALERELYRRSRHPQPIKKRETPPAFIPVETLDEYARQLQDELEELIILFLDGYLSPPQTKIRGSQLLEETRVSLTDKFTATHPTPPSFNPQARRILRVLEETARDFTQIIEETPATPYWATAEGLKRRIEMLALALIYRLNAQLTIELAHETRAKWLRYNTMQDPKVCPICDSLQGTYPAEDPNLPTIPQHPLCRCWYTIEYH